MWELEFKMQEVRSLSRRKLLYHVVSRRPTLKSGSGETVYKKFEFWNVYWMTFYVLRKCTVYVTTSIQPDPLTASPN